MAQIKSTEQLQEHIKHCTACFEQKLNSKGKRSVLICGGTGCLANESKEILEKIREEIKLNGLEEKVEVNQVGCFGFCSQGPFVKIMPEDTLYRTVRVEDVTKIVQEDLIGHKIVEDLLYVDPQTQKKVVKQDEINFYKKQKRIALHGCSVIDPENIEEALGYDGFKGLLRALSMQPQEVIDEVLTAGLRGRGGAGFPTGKKWQFAHDVSSEIKYVVCNGDEGDPGA